jgi:hypothetical protein
MDTLGTYTPFLEPERWDLLRPIVSACIEAHVSRRRAADRKPIATALALAHLVNFFDWVAATGYAPLSTCALNADIIDAYTVVRSTEVRPNVAERERKTLRAVAGLPAVRERRKHSTTSTPNTPYTATERARIHAWAANQPDAARERNCAVIATLCLGAGLTTRELLAACVGDIRVAADGMPTVRVVGARARLVPFTLDWVADARRLSDIDDPGAKLFRPRAHVRDKGLVSETLRTSIGDIKPTPQRLRNTWLVDHLEAGTPILLLTELAGLKTADAFGRLLRYTPPVQPDRALRFARLTGVTS